MAAKSTEGATDAFLSPIRAALTCLAPCTVFGSGQALGREHEVALFTAELLIRDFAVMPARADWQAVLQRYRQAIVPAGR